MIRLVIADDHPVVREGLRRIASEGSDIAVVGEAASADELLGLLPRTRADVLLLDISMPGPGVAELLRQLRTTYPRLHTLVLSVHPEDRYAVRALKAGAAGYLTKDRSPEELLEAVRKVNRGGVYVSSSLGERLARRVAQDGDRPPHEMLSHREFDVLCRLGGGQSLKEIGSLMGVSPKTVSTYRSRILEKLRLETNAELVRYVIEHDLGA